MSFKCATSKIGAKCSRFPVHSSWRLCKVSKNKPIKMMEPMGETIRHRVDRGGDVGTSNFTRNPSAPEESKPPVSPQIDKTANARNNMLLMAIGLPCTILLVFGGKVSLLIVCFGGLLAYIFDLIGSVEVTFIVVLMTILGLLGSLIWAARVVINENVFNFSIVVMMGLLLFQLGAVMASHFSVVLHELGVLYEVIDPLIFATLPLLASTLISWFLCVEVPALDLESTFTIVYTLYVLVVLNPRYKGGREIAVKKNQTSGVAVVGSSPNLPVLPRHVLMVVYGIPVIISMVVHAALHHNVLSTAKTRIIGFVMSILFPSFLMLVCARRQIAYWPLQSRSGVLSRVNWSSGIVGVLMLLCLQDHPFFDEIKSFSGLEEPWSSYLMVGVLFMLGFAYSWHRYAGQFKSSADEIDAISASGHQSARSSEYLNILESLVSLCVGLAAALATLLVGIPFKVLPVAVIGAMAVAEYYHRASWGLTNKVLLIIIGAISLAIVAVAFTHRTLFYLLFGFSWHVDLSMQQFCAYFAILCAFSVLVPAIVKPAGGSKTSGGADFMDLLPGGRSDKSKFGMFRGVFKRVFSYCLMGLTLVMAAAELMLREQDWSSVEATVETVYPTYYLLATAGAVVLTGFALYAARITGPATLWVLLAIQGGKLLHLVGLPSLACATVVALSLTYSLPFIRHIHTFLRLSSEMEAQDALSNGLAKIATLHPAEVALFAFTALLATYWARYHVAYTALSGLLGTDPSDLQLNTACIAAFCLYLSCLLLVFYKQARLLRSLLLGVVLVCTLIATEGLGKLSFAADPSSPLLLSVSLHPDMALNEHTSLFILLSGALSLSAFVGLLPLQNPLISLLYALVFSYTSTRATLGWAFPLSLGDDELTHSLWAFPFVYIYSSKFLNTFVALRHTDNNAVLTQALFGVICAMPFLAVVYCYFRGIYDVSIKGIVWSTIISTASLCVTVRTCEFVSDIKLLNRGASLGSVVNKASRAMTAHIVMLICVMCSVLCVFWTSVAIAVDSRLDRDLLVPAAIVLFLTSRRGTLLPDVHPVAIVAVLSGLWWTLSALHALFVRGFSADILAAGSVAGDFHYQQHSLLGLDSDVSIWTSGNAWYYTLLHILVLLLPLPGIVLSFRKSKHDSEDVLFALALISAIAIVAGPVGSMRYLGLLGGVYSGWRCYEIGQTKKLSDRLI